jgi:hypothetical protein
MLAELRSSNALELPWALNDMRKYDISCRGSEIRSTLSAEQGRQVLLALYYDRRPTGSRGRSLMIDLPLLRLEKGDRLEPCPAIPFPTQFDLHDQWPVQAVFWRCSAESWAKHRSPLMDPAIGITLDVICIDNLHTMALGIYKNFVTFALWSCLRGDIYQVGQMYADVEKDEISVLRMASELKRFYKEFKRGNPHAPLSEIGDLDLKVLGSRASPSLHAKGAETEGLLAFVVFVLRLHSHILPSGGLLLAAAEALNEFQIKLRESSHNPLPRESQDS